MVREKQGLFNVLFILPLLLVFTAYFIYPLFYVVYTSLHSWTGYTPRVFVGLGQSKHGLAQSSPRRQPLVRNRSAGSPRSS